MEATHRSKAALPEQLSCYVQAYGNHLERSRAFVGYLVCALLGCMPFIVSALSHVSRVKITTYVLSELERDKHSELPTELRTALFNVGITNESDRPEDLIVNYLKEDHFILYVVKKSQCQKGNRCLTGFYYKLLLTFDRKYLEQNWPGGDILPDWMHPHIEPLAASFVFIGKCSAVQSLKESPHWGTKLLLLIECLAANNALEGTPLGIWLTGRGPSINKDVVVPSK